MSSEENLVWFPDSLQEEVAHQLLLARSNEEHHEERPRKMKKIKVQRKWQHIEVLSIIERLKRTISSGKELEKPTADVYYAKMLSKLKISCCTVSQIKNKVKNLRTNYLNAIQWRNLVGQRVLEQEGADMLTSTCVTDIRWSIIERCLVVFAEATLQRCPYFDDLDEIYGTKIKVDALCSRSVEIGDFDGTPAAVVRPTYIETQETESYRRAESPICDNSQEVRAAVRKMRVEEDRDLMKAPFNGGAKALAEAINRKTEFDNRRLDVEEKKLDFEREKFRAEMELRRRQLDLEVDKQRLEEKKLELEAGNVRYEIELRYKTQLEIAKLTGGNA